MKTRGSFTGLGTLVALRTYLTFCLCAAVPIILAATLGNRIVSSSLREQAQSHLRDTSKAYGLLIFERLRLADELLSNLARAALRADAAGVQELRQFHSSHLRIVAIDLGAQNDVTPGAAAAAGTVQGTLQSLTLQGQQVILTVTHQQGNRTAKIAASLDADYLWDADAVLATAMQICILAERGQIMHCIGDALTGDAAVDARWSLFLPARYGSSAWQIRTRQSNAVVFTALDTLRRTIAIVTAASVLIALLLSVIQIRRNHEPLTQLTKAARRMGRRRFDERLTIDTKDEYAKLGRAFNTMASSLSRQFLLLRTLGRIDRMILAEPSIEVLVKRILPSLPRLLESDSVVFALATDRGVTVHVARKGSPCVEVLPTKST